MILLSLNLILPIITAFACFIKNRYLMHMAIIFLNILLVATNVIIILDHQNINQEWIILHILGNYKISFNSDFLTSLFALMVSGLYLFTNLYSFYFLKAQENSELNKDLNPQFYFFFTPLAIMSALGVAYSSNLLTLFIFYELLTLFTYPLVIQSFSDHARKVGKFYITILMCSSMFFLMFALIYLDQNYGATEFTKEGIFSEQTSVKDIVILLICFVFGFSKSAIFPLHSWLPKAMVAPIPVSALLHAVAVVKSGIFALIKVFVYLFGLNYLKNMHQQIPWSLDWLTYLGCFTMIYAGFIACRQDNLKKILAYSTISQLSYMIVFLSLISTSTLTMSILQMLSHSIAKITLFFAVGIIYIATHKVDIIEMKGMARALPLPTALFILAAFSIIGLPPSVGWVLKGLIFKSIECITLAEKITITCLIISSLMACYYYLKPIYFMLSPASTEERPEIFYNNTNHLSLITLVIYSLSFVLFIYLDTIIACIDLFLKK